MSESIPVGLYSFSNELTKRLQIAQANDVVAYAVASTVSDDKNGNPNIMVGTRFFIGAKPFPKSVGKQRVYAITDSEEGIISLTAGDLNQLRIKNFAELKEQLTYTTLTNMLDNRVKNTPK